MLVCVIMASSLFHAHFEQVQDCLLLSEFIYVQNAFACEKMSCFVLACSWISERRVRIFKRRKQKETDRGGKRELERL